MAILNVNATRMELNKLKNRLLTTRKGHKLLKNKVDGLLREFLKISKETLTLKKYIREKIVKAKLNLELSKIKTSEEQVNFALSNKTENLNIKVLESNILGVSTVSFKAEDEKNLNLNYSFFSNSYFLDESVKQSKEIFLNLIKLAEKEKKVLTLSSEIEKTKRKVNAIENILIPNLEDTIKYIALKLEENGRNMIAALTRIK